MSCKEVSIARENLIKALGNKSKLYFQHMKLWFQMKTTKEEFDLQTRQLLDSSQAHMHNEFLLQLYLACSKQHLPASSLPLPHSKKPKRGAQQHDNGFQAANMHDYVQPRVAHKPHAESNHYFVQDRLLPDSEIIHMRLMMAAWELGLEGAESGAAQVLEIAVQHFVKNILQTILSRRNGFCVGEGRVQYGVGIPVPNPWLKNTAGFLIERSDGYRSVLEEQQEKKSSPIPLQGRETQQDVAITHAASLNPSHKSPVTMADCFEALQIYRGAVKSNGVYSINMERISAGMYHSSWDHTEE